MGLIKIWCRLGMGPDRPTTDGHQIEMITKESGQPTNAGQEIHMITKESGRSTAAGHHIYVHERFPPWP